MSKSHKSECKARNQDVQEESNISWQAVVYDRRCALKRKDFDKAIASFVNVLKSRMMFSLLVQIASCYLSKGDAKTGLDFAYNACQSAYEDLQSMVLKARCHRKLGDIEAAYYCAYTAYNPHTSSHWRYARRGAKGKFSQRSISRIHSVTRQD